MTITTRLHMASVFRERAICGCFWNFHVLEWLLSVSHGIDIPAVQGRVNNAIVAFTDTVHFYKT